MWEVGKETIVSTWDLLKATTEKKKKALVLLASVFPVICVVGHCWDSIYSPGIPRNGGPSGCFRVLSLNTWMLYPAWVRKLTKLWPEILFRNTAIVWHFGAITGRALGWVSWFIARWLGSSEIYSYNSLSSY